MYNTLDADILTIVLIRTQEIKALVSRTAQDIIEIGLRLCEVKALLPHGKFGKWLKTEFDWTQRTAQNFMQVAEMFKNEKISHLSIAPSALYLLAAPSTPISARQEAILLANSGEFITRAKAKMLIESHKTSDGTEFLDKFDSEQKPLKPRMAKPVKLNFTLLLSERDRVQNTLDVVKQRQGLHTDAEALMYIIDYFWQAYDE